MVNSIESKEVSRFGFMGTFMSTTVAPKVSEGFSVAAEKTKSAALSAGSTVAEKTKEATINTGAAVYDNPLACASLCATGCGLVAPIAGLPFAAGLVAGQALKEREIVDLTGVLNSAGTAWRSGVLAKAAMVGGIAGLALWSPPVAIIGCAFTAGLYIGQSLSSNKQVPAKNTSTELQAIKA